MNIETILETLRECESRHRKQLENWSNLTLDQRSTTLMEMRHDFEEALGAIRREELGIRV